MKKKMKDKYWKYLTIILMIVGIASLFFSNATAFPYEITVNSTTDKTKTYEMVNGGIKKASIITDLDPDDIDQFQNHLDAAIRIGVGSTGCSILQPVVNDREPMTGFLFYVARHGTPSDDIWFGIMYPHRYCPFDGENYMALASLKPLNIPFSDKFYWYGIDLSDNPLDIPSGTPALNIVVVSVDDPDDDNYWLWGCSTTNPYTNYHPFGWNTNDEEWQDELLPEGIDMCFATYTPSNGGDIPVITITSTSWVTANIGFACLIAAAISGCKWATLLL